jgi:hypothetical protein
VAKPLESGALRNAVEKVADDLRRRILRLRIVPDLLPELLSIFVATAHIPPDPARFLVEQHRTRILESVVVAREDRRRRISV